MAIQRDIDQTSLRGMFALPADMLYLDTAAHGPPLKSVRAAAQAALEQSTTSWLGGHGWRGDVERLRALAAQLFDHDADATLVRQAIGEEIAVDG